MSSSSNTPTSSESQHPNGNSEKKLEDFDREGTINSVERGGRFNELLEQSSSYELRKETSNNSFVDFQVSPSKVTIRNFPLHKVGSLFPTFLERIQEMEKLELVNDTDESRSCSKTAEAIQAVTNRVREIQNQQGQTCEKLGINAPKQSDQIDTTVPSIPGGFMHTLTQCSQNHIRLYPGRQTTDLSPFIYDDDPDYFSKMEHDLINAYFTHDIMLHWTWAPIETLSESIHPDILQFGLGLYYGTLLGLGMEFCSQIEGPGGEVPKSRMEGMTKMMIQCLFMDISGKRKMTEMSCCNNSDNDDLSSMTSWCQREHCHTSSEIQSLVHLALSIESDLRKRCKGDVEEYETFVDHFQSLQRFFTVSVLNLSMSSFDTNDIMMNGGCVVDLIQQEYESLVEQHHGKNNKQTKPEETTTPEELGTTTSQSSTTKKSGKGKKKSKAKKKKKKKSNEPQSQKEEEDGEEDMEPESLPVRSSSEDRPLPQSKDEAEEKQILSPEQQQKAAKAAALVDDFKKQQRRWVGLSQRLSQHVQDDLLHSLRSVRKERQAQLSAQQKWRNMSDQYPLHFLSLELKSLFLKLYTRKMEASSIITRLFRKHHLFKSLKILLTKEKCGPNSACQYYINRRLGLESQDVFQGVLTIQNLLEGKTEQTFVAVKKLRKSEVIAGRTKSADNEIQVMKKAMEEDLHPNVLRILSVDKGKEYIYLGLELCHGSIADKDFFEVGEFGSEERLELCTQMIDGILHLHKNGIFHRDIKPANMLYVRNPRDGKFTIKVADMGIAKTINLEMTSHTITKKAVGTESYMPTELYDEHFLSKNGRWTKDELVAIDIFSLGCVLHYVMTEGWHPWGMNECGRRIRPNRIAFAIEDQEDPNLSLLNSVQIHGGRGKDITHLILRMISHDRTKRGTALDAASHPVFWSEATKMQYLERCFRRADFVTKIGGTPPHEHFQKDADWRRLLSTKLWDPPNKVGSFLPPSSGTGMTMSYLFYNKTLFDFVRFVRNIMIHFQEYVRGNHAIIGILFEHQMKRKKLDKSSGTCGGDCGGVMTLSRFASSLMEDLVRQEQILGEYFFSQVDMAITVLYDTFGASLD